MHKALYRKWRPSNFDEVVGQDHITSVLKYEAQTNNYNHAYLFCGSRGTGKTTCAKILAKVINCEDPQDGNPCGKCNSCVSIDSGIATDVLEMDAASNNGVENIRDIRNEVVYTPSELKYRVYIIDEVHMLSSSAFNALLKTLEEPPKHVIFILATTEMHKLPATIISRCQRFDFRRISTTVLRDRILWIANAESIGIDDSAATTIAKHAQGGMRDAISLLELCAGQREKITEELVSTTIGSAGRQKTVETVRAVAEKDYETIFSHVSDIVMSSMDIAIFWQDLISVFRDLLVIKTTKNSTDYLDLTDSELEQLGKVANLFTKEKILYVCLLLDGALSSMQKSNGIKRIIAEMALVRMCDESLDTSNEALASRISALEDKINSGSFTTPNVIKHEAPPKKAKVSVDNNTEKSIQEPVEKLSATEEAKNKPQSLRCLAEVAEKIFRESPLVSSFLKDCKGYRRDDGKVVLCFDNKVALQMLDDKIIKNSIACAISAAIKAPLTENDLLFNLTEQKINDDTLADFE